MAKGTIHLRKDAGWHVILWWDDANKRQVKISRDPDTGRRMYDPRHAQDVLGEIRAEHKRGTLRLEKYTRENWSEVTEYIDEWFKAVSPDLKPSTVVGYEKSIRLYLKPFFDGKKMKLKDIQFDTIKSLLNTIKTGPNKKVASTVLKSCLRYAWRSRRIDYVPPFPEVRLQETSREWLTEEQQTRVINRIPEEHRPIFWWIVLHLRRPNEAQALRWEDWDAEAGVFNIRRGVSREVVGSTKTDAEYRVPCHRDFRATIDSLRRGFGTYIFWHRSNQADGNRYQLQRLEDIWNKACEAEGFSIPLYKGTRKSRASQLMNEYGLSESEVQMAGDWKDVRTVKCYAQATVARRKELLEGKVVRMPERKAEG